MLWNLLIIASAVSFWRLALKALASELNTSIKKMMWRYQWKRECRKEQ